MFSEIADAREGSSGGRERKGPALRVGPHHSTAQSQVGVINWQDTRSTKMS
jgi:hypothetical protein